MCRNLEKSNKKGRPPNIKGRRQGNTQDLIKLNSNTPSNEKNIYVTHFNNNKKSIWETDKLNNTRVHHYCVAELALILCLSDLQSFFIIFIFTQAKVKYQACSDQEAVGNTYSRQRAKHVGSWQWPGCIWGPWYVYDSPVKTISHRRSLGTSHQGYLGRGIKDWCSQNTPKRQSAGDS